MKKAAKERMFKQNALRAKQREDRKRVDLGKQPVTRAQLQGVQNTGTLRTDKALMGIAAIIKILVDNKLCTYEDYNAGEKKLLGVLNNIRTIMLEAGTELGSKASPEDVGSYVYEKAVEGKIADKEILTHIFGLKPSKSRIIKPRAGNGVIVSK